VSYCTSSASIHRHTGWWRPKNIHIRPLQKRWLSKSSTANQRTICSCMHILHTHTHTRTQMLRGIEHQGLSQDRSLVSHSNCCAVETVSLPGGRLTGRRTTVLTHMHIQHSSFTTRSLLSRHDPFTPRRRA
jgi:hypothetical protein